MKQLDILKAFLGDEVYEGLNKSLQKLNTKSVVDLQELHATIKTVPKAVLAFLMRELKPMKKGEAKEIKLPYHKNAMLLINKADNDVYGGNITQDGKIIHEFSLVSMPQLAAHLMSTYELYEGVGETNKESSENTPAGEPIIPEAHKEESSIKEQQEISDLKHDLMGEKIKLLESKIDQIIMLLAQPKAEAIEKNEDRSNKMKLMLKSLSSLKKVGVMPTMPKSPAPGRNAGQQGITKEGFHSPKTANTDMPGHDPKTAVANPFLKPGNAKQNQPKQPTQPKEPGQTKSSLTVKSEGSSHCPDCGEYTLKKSEYQGCACFKGLSRPQLKKNENGTTTFYFDADWDTDSKWALYKTLQKKGE